MKKFISGFAFLCALFSPFSAMGNALFCGEIISYEATGEVIDITLLEDRLYVMNYSFPAANDDLNPNCSKEVIEKIKIAIRQGSEVCLGGDPYSRLCGDHSVIIAE